MTDGVSGDDASDGDELTPVTATVSSSKAFASHHYAAPTTARARLPDEALPASTLVHRLGRAGNGASPWRAHRAPSGDQGPPSADMSVLARAVTNDGTSQDSAATLGHLVPGGGLPSVPAPAAWAILLMGVLGLIAIARQPGVARAQSWAMSSLSSSVTRSAAGIRRRRSRRPQPVPSGPGPALAPRPLRARRHPRPFRRGRLKRQRPVGGTGPGKCSGGPFRRSFFRSGGVMGWPTSARLASCPRS